MKAKVKSIADELREDLERCPDLRAQELIDLNESIANRIANFEKNVGSSQKQEWESLKSAVAEVCDYAQKAKMRLLFGDHEVVHKLDTLHEKLDSNEIDDLVGSGRSEHQLHGVSDVLKSLMMWKDNNKV